MKLVYAFLIFGFSFSAFGSTQKSVFVKVSHSLLAACADTKKVATNEIAEIKVNIADDGSAYGYLGKTANLSLCDYFFWIGLEITKSAEKNYFIIKGIQYGSKDGSNGLGIGNVYCQTSDLDKVPICGIQHISKIDDSPSVHGALRLEAGK